MGILLRKALRSVGLQPIGDHLDLSGHLYLDYKNESGDVVSTEYLGKNTIMYPLRVIVAKLLARKAVDVLADSPTSSFPLGIDGYDADDNVFPAYVYIGIDSTPATPEDTRLGYYLTTTDDPGDPPIRFPLSRVLVRSSKAQYDAVFEQINVAFEFDIPNGTLRSAPDAETTPYLLREFGLTSNDGDEYPIVGAPAVLGDPQIDTGSPPTLLARKVATVIKLSEFSITIRWEIRT